MVIVFAIAIAPAVAEPVSLDRAYELVGTWNCQTAAGSSAAMTFARESDGSISMRSSFANANGSPGEFDETYRFVTSAQYWSWTATQPSREDFKEAATGGEWTAQKWFFDGTVTQRPHRHDTDTHRIRMIYTWISSSSFEREFELYDGGVWRTIGSSVCRRASS